jgi:hypothetical protein
MTGLFSVVSNDLVEFTASFDDGEMRNTTKTPTAIRHAVRNIMVPGSSTRENGDEYVR